MNNFDIWGIEYIASQFNPLPLDDEFLNNRYTWQAVSNGQEWPYYRFFYRLSALLQPDMIVELGGYQGSAAAHFAAGWPEGRVVTIDHHTDPGDDINKKRMTEAILRYSNLLYIQGWTNPETCAREFGKHSLGNAGNALPLVIQQQRKIDILFIDSWHTYENAMIDWHTYKPLLNSPALVICDDIQDGEADHSPVSGMMRFWREMPDPKFLNTSLHPGTSMGFFKYESPSP